MDYLLVALFIIAGFVFIVIEMFIVPGFSVPGLVGIAMIGYGIFRANMEFGLMGVALSLGGSLLCAAGLITVFVKSRAARKIGLDYDERNARAIDDYSALVGKSGVALTPLRPSGTAIIEAVRCDVVTDGEYYEKDCPVRVVAVDGTRIVVAKTNSET